MLLQVEPTPKPKSKRFRRRFTAKKAPSVSVRHNFAFIDSQNLNLGTQKMGWKMDWRKYREWLRDTYDVSRAYMFLGHMPEHEDLYEQLHEQGYLVVLKPTQDTNKLPQEEGEAANEHHGQPEPEEKKPIKGNIDADLVLWAMREYENYNKAIIVSGDGDFFSLVEYLDEQGKLLHIMTPNWQYSSLLKPFEKYIIRLDQKRSVLAYRNRRHVSSKKKK